MAERANSLPDHATARHATARDATARHATASHATAPIVFSQPGASVMPYCSGGTSASG
ncbi:hypothetical protein J2S43_004870 [Catenuloplanes nepalensis]|uniref:Uncharacterized protein n=1 Tax=Catenuloplanes nepalensis TaxID=587533 RepID=A0ABT9MY37_9ACTN|nr:hypothetical protein [Catenuloplanes nepalensis]